MGPPQSFLWNLGFIDLPELRKVFCRTDHEKSRLRQGGPSSLLSTFFYTEPKKAKNLRKVRIAKSLWKNINTFKFCLKQDESHNRSGGLKRKTWQKAMGSFSKSDLDTSTGSASLEPSHFAASQQSIRFEPKVSPLPLILTRNKTPFFVGFDHFWFHTQ